jgi:TIGR03009 family protein
VRTLIACTLTLAIGASAGAQGTAPPTRKAGQAATARPAAAPLDPKAEKARLEADAASRVEMDRVLAAWEAKSKSVKSLDVLFDRIDRSPGWGDKYYQGRAMLQSPDLACLQFQKYKVGAEGKPQFALTKDNKKVAQLEPEPFERIVCTGNEVLQYDWNDKKIFIFPLDKSVRQKALQQGPLPFLFNMKAADARRRYSMSLVKQDDRDYLIGILPYEDIDKQSFSQAFLWLNKKTFLPDKLSLYMVGGKERQDFLFTGDVNTILTNSPLDNKFFLPNRFPGWTVVDNPNADGAPAAGKAVVAPGQPPRKAASQPATKPGTRPQ